LYESYGCGAGIVGGRAGGCGIANEGGTSVIRNGSKDGLAAEAVLPSHLWDVRFYIRLR